MIVGLFRSDVSLGSPMAMWNKEQVRGYHEILVGALNPPDAFLDWKRVHVCQSVSAL